MRVNATLDPFAVIRREFERRISQANQNRSCRSAGCAVPLTARRQDEGLLLEFEVPGVAMDNVELSIEDGVLELSANRPKPDQEMARNERFFGPLSRRVELPEDLDPDSIDAVLKNGVLTVRFEERQELKPVKVEIRQGS
mgnify:CR=1 FL=1